MGLKYTTELTNKVIADYKSGLTAKEIAEQINAPERSVIAKLSNLGIYKRKSYLNKQGVAPIKKEQHIEHIADMLDIDICLLDSLEKVTKTALTLIENRLVKLKSDLEKQTSEIEK